MKVAEKIRLRIADKPYCNGQVSVSFTISLGICGRKDEEDITELTRKADSALYEAKKNGRNNSTFYNSELIVNNECKKSVLSLSV